LPDVAGQGDENAAPGVTREAQLPAVAEEAEAPRAAGVAGLVFAALFAVSLLLLRRQPPTDSTAVEVEEWFLDRNRTRVALVGLYLVPFTGIAFLWFTAVIRRNVAAFRDRFFDTALIGSAILFITMLFAAGAAGGSLMAAVEFRDAPVPGPDAVAMARALSYTFFFVYALRAAAVFVIVTCTIGLRGGGLPRWLAISGYVIAVILLLSVSYFSVVALLFPAWVAAVSVVLLVSRGSADGRGVRSTDA
jgi:hypothetical protein